MQLASCSRASCSQVLVCYSENKVKANFNLKVHSASIPNAVFESSFQHCISVVCLQWTSSGLRREQR